jgi:transposase
VLTLGFSGRILVAVESVDGRKGIDSLAGVVRSVLHGDPLSGDLFVFKNRRGDKPKNQPRRSGRATAVGPWQWDDRTGCT